MRWKDARRSQNVEDRRRGRSRGRRPLGGVGLIVVAAVAIFLWNESPDEVIQEVRERLAELPVGGSVYEPTLAEEELAEFTRTVLAFTEDVWATIYGQVAPSYRGARPRYQEPTLVLFSGVTPTACGRGEAGMGPFYCPGDSQVYIDLAFFNELETKFEAPGDFAQAYVIAHEVGHHVQNLLGVSGQVHAQQSRVSQEEYNRLSVRLELQADYFAGVWAHHAQGALDVLQEGDLEEGIRAAMAVGDDTIQRQATGRVVPEAFTHGSAEQRIRWFLLGFESGDPAAHSPFEMAYERL